MPISILPILQENEVVNNDIEDSNGQVLGKIANLLLDTAEGRIAYALLSTKGFLGRDKDFYAIPWSALSPAQRRHTYKLKFDSEFMKSAPHFDSDHPPDFTNMEWNADMYAYYKVPPYWQPASILDEGATAPSSSSTHPVWQGRQDDVQDTSPSTTVQTEPGAS